MASKETPTFQAGMNGSINHTTNHQQPTREQMDDLFSVAMRYGPGITIAAAANMLASTIRDAILVNEDKESFLQVQALLSDLADKYHG